MQKLPFEIEINSKHNSQIQQVICHKLLRDVPSVRRVYSGMWNQQPVIVKIFVHSFKAVFSASKEYKKTQRLIILGINVPRILFTGKTAEGHYAVVSERITEAQDVRALFEQDLSVEERYNIISAVTGQLAIQHDKGVLQRDLHLGNFLYRASVIYSLDAAEMKFYDDKIELRKSIEHLASLLCGHEEIIAHKQREIFSRYLEARGLKFNENDFEYFKQQLELQRLASMNRWLKKTLRSGKRFVEYKKYNYRAVFNRELFADVNLAEFIGKIDTTMKEGQILKDSRTSFVSASAVNGKKIVIKRYNNKGFIHSFIKSFKSSRAKKSWLNSYMMTILAIPTPKPLGFIECKFGHLVWRSYIITEFIDGFSYYDLLNKKSALDAEKNEIKLKLYNIFGRLKRFKISHRDLKHSNIIISSKTPLLLDTDAVKTYKTNFFFMRRWQKDMRIFDLGKKVK
jgi:tRNA A-37 threonylcarbamoyl transferase component Bud32